MNEIVNTSELFLAQIETCSWMKYVAHAILALNDYGSN
jgi:hypothetical protein